MMGVILELPRRSTDQEDENKAVKTFSELLENSSLSKKAYIYYEVLFRQLMMCDEAKTGIRYDLDEPKAHFFCGKLDPQERIKRIESFLSSHRNKSVYAFNRLTFDKKDKVREISLDIKKALESVELIRERAESVIHEENIPFIDLKKEAEALHKRIVSQAKKKISRLNGGSAGFLALDENNRLTVNITQYEFFRHYCRIYYGLIEAHFALNNVNDNSDRNGCQAFIASKLNFEFGSHLGMTFNSELVRKRLDLRTKDSSHALASKIKIIDSKFVECLIPGLS